VQRKPSLAPEPTPAGFFPASRDTVGQIGERVRRASRNRLPFLAGEGEREGKDRDKAASVHVERNTAARWSPSFPSLLSHHFPPLKGFVAVPPSRTPWYRHPATPSRRRPPRSRHGSSTKRRRLSPPRTSTVTPTWSPSSPKSALGRPQLLPHTGSLISLMLDSGRESRPSSLWALPGALPLLGRVRLAAR
jgi:hypothetical protein